MPSSAKTLERPTKKAKFEKESIVSQKPARPILKSSKQSVKVAKHDNHPTAGSSLLLKNAAPIKAKPSTMILRADDKSTGVTSAVEEVADAALPTTFKVMAGSYEKLLYGLEGSFLDSEGNISLKPVLHPIFIFPAHVACVKAITASPDGGKWLATGSTDEIVKVWDLRRRKEIGGLIQHEGSITHLSFPSRSHLLSASEDGTICLFRARDWVLLRSLRGHKGAVNSVAVHPSGKVGLSVGKDRTLRMWDLMRGKGSASTKLGKEGELVRWSSTGDRFIVQSQCTIDVYSTEMTLLHTLTHPSRLHDIKFCKRINGDGELLLAAAEDKKVTIYSIEHGSNTSLPVVGELVRHQNRVKAMDTLAIALPSSELGRSSTTIISTVSSDGKIRIFDLGDLPAPAADVGKVAIEPIAEYDTKGTRLTCCTLADGEYEVVGTKVKKRKLNEGDGVEDESAVDDDNDALSMTEEVLVENATE